MGFWRKIFTGPGRGKEKDGHNFDPGSRYCPACDGEYRSEISHCAACGLELISGEEHIAAWQKGRDERARSGREIATSDLVAPVLTGKLPDMKASGLVLAAVGIACRISAVSGCGGG